MACKSIPKELSSFLAFSSNGLYLWMVCRPIRTLFSRHFLSSDANSTADDGIDHYILKYSTLLQRRMLIKKLHFPLHKSEM